MRLHQWAFATEAWRQQQGLEGGERNADDEVIREVVEGVGAYIMGRNMFGGGDGPWAESWRGWWGDEPPFHAPVFVLTHQPRAPLEMEGGTKFTFVTDGIESALDQARGSAGGRRRHRGRGEHRAAIPRRRLPRRALPPRRSVLLGGGERLLEGVGDPVLRPVKVVASPAVTHVKYRLGG